MHIHNRTPFHSGPENDLVENCYAAGRRLVIMRPSSCQAESSRGVVVRETALITILVRSCGIQTLAKKRGEAELDAEIEDIVDSPPKQTGGSCWLARARVLREPGY